MRPKIVVVLSALVLMAGLALADLTPWKDYDVSESVWLVTTVKVNANMGDAYLEGLKATWISGNEVAKKLGQIEDYKILRSDLPESGDFNLLLMVKFKNSDAFGPNKKRYEDFVNGFTEQKMKETSEQAQRDYPAMRKLTGEYLLREITLK
jgi:hypothetical protein